jgi:hypothetical protein
MGHGDVKGRLSKPEIIPSSHPVCLRSGVVVLDESEKAAGAAS